MVMYISLFKSEQQKSYKFSNSCLNERYIHPAGVGPQNAFPYIFELISWVYLCIVIYNSLLYTLHQCMRTGMIIPLIYFLKAVALDYALNIHYNLQVAIAHGFKSQTARDPLLCFQRGQPNLPRVQFVVLLTFWPCVFLKA